jgi:hypothetical protein
MSLLRCRYFDVFLTFASPYTHLLVQVSSELFDVKNGLFVYSATDHVSYQINPLSGDAVGPHHLQYFRFAGWLIGKALLDGQVGRCGECVYVANGGCGEWWVWRMVGVCVCMFVCMSAIDVR